MALHAILARPQRANHANAIGGIVDHEVFVGSKPVDCPSLESVERETLNIRLAFGERDSPRGRDTFLGASGQGQFVGNLMRYNDNINFVAKQTLPGTITPGRPHIVYVEGDRPIVVDGTMTVEDFAEVNPGNYPVVTVEVK